MLTAKEEEGAPDKSSSTQNDYRQSYLDYVRDNLSQEPILYRIVICGRLNKTIERKEEINNYYDSIFHTEQQMDSGSIVSGMLLIYSTMFVHFLEGDSKVIQTFLADLNNPNHDYFRKIKKRCYGFWAIRNVALHLEEQVVDIKPESIHTSIGQMVINMTSMGNHLTNLNKNDLKPALDDLTSRYREFLPKPDFVSTLVQSKNVTSMEEYMEIFYSHGTIPLDVDLVWPAPRRIKV